MAGMNYAEERVYWYLRLNGFFSLKNYVLHKDNENHYNGDIDLLAVRFPNVYERIGGDTNDFDKIIPQILGKETFEEIQKPILFIVEVKSGRYQKQKIFNNIQHLKMAIARSGIFKYNESSILKIAKELFKNSFIEKPEAYIVKVLFSEKEERCDKYVNILLNSVRKFILLRILDYCDEKASSRLFFNSELFQESIDLIRVIVKNVGKEGARNWINNLE